MKCKKCKEEIPDYSRFCLWCGVPVVKEKTKVPTPRLLGSGQWNIQLRKEGISVTEPTREKCIAKAIALREGWAKADKKTANTVGELVDSYIEDNAPQLSPATVKAYRSYRKHRFQNLFDSDLRRANYQRAINAESEKVSAKTVNNAWRLITAAFNYASVEPPTVKLPTVVTEEKQFLDYEQINAFVAGIRGDEIELPALIALHGLRRSEIYDLRFEDIDLTAETLRVAGSAVFGEDGMLIHKRTNKNKTSARVVPLMIPRLKELLTAQNGAHGYIYEGDEHLSDRINTRCKRLNLPCVGVHGLRHSAVSLAWHLKWDALTTMKVFGYSNLATVQTIYTHLAEADKNSHVQEMAAFYGAESVQ